MKKYLALFLALLMVLSLCACGGNGGNKSDKIISMNEPVDENVIQFTLTGIGDFVDNYSMNDKSHYEGLGKDGYKFVEVYYTVKYIGNESLRITPALLTMNYSDGFKFSSDRVWYFDKDTFLDENAIKKGEKGAWTNNCPDITPFDDAIECVSVFQLPNEIETSTEPWSITISICGTDYLYTIRK